MPKTSAGLLMYRKRGDLLEFFLVHPGGPFWASKEYECWSIPKGELDDAENELVAAKREFEEETGWKAEEPFIELLPITQKNGKVVHAWAFEGDRDPSTMVSNTCEIEFPPGSGKRLVIPEVDRGAYFTLDEARKRANPAQVALLEELTEKIKFQS